MFWKGRSLTDSTSWQTAARSGSLTSSPCAGMNKVADDPRWLFRPINSTMALRNSWSLSR